MEMDMAIAFSKTISEAGAHSRLSQVSVSVSAHDEQHGDASILVQIESGNAASYAHISCKSARRIAAALNLACSAVESSEVSA